MMKILLGTSNPSKVRFFEQFIEQEGVTLVTPKELGIEESPEENGNTPVENAVLKAAFYSQFAPCVICADSGLYFDELPLDDPRQPGLHIRTPQGVRLDDEEMIDYYAQLVHSLGGKVTAYYLDGVALRVGIFNGVLHKFASQGVSAQALVHHYVFNPHLATSGAVRYAQGQHCAYVVIGLQQE